MRICKHSILSHWEWFVVAGLRSVRGDPAADDEGKTEDGGDAPAAPRGWDQQGVRHGPSRRLLPPGRVRHVCQDGAPGHGAWSTQLLNWQWYWWNIIIIFDSFLSKFIFFNNFYKTFVSFNCIFYVIHSIDNDNYFFHFTLFPPTSELKSFVDIIIMIKVKYWSAIGKWWPAGQIRPRGPEGYPEHTIGKPTMTSIRKTPNKLKNITDYA